MIFTFNSRAFSNFDSPPSRPTSRWVVLLLIEPVTRPPYFSIKFLHSSRSSDSRTPENIREISRDQTIISSTRTGNNHSDILETIRCSFWNWFRAWCIRSTSIHKCLKIFHASFFLHGIDFCCFHFFLRCCTIWFIHWGIFVNWFCSRFAWFRSSFDNKFIFIVIFVVNMLSYSLMNFNRKQRSIVFFSVRKFSSYFIGFSWWWWNRTFFEETSNISHGWKVILCFVSHS